jgi:hypothetical protein
MRKAAQDNDYDSFAKGLPRKFKQGKMLFKTLQKALGVKSLKEYIEEGRPNQAARSLSDPKFRAKTEKDRKKATKKGYKKHKGRMYEDEKIMTFKQAQEKDKKDQNKDPVGSQHEGILDTLFPKELSAAQKRIYKKEYSAASKLYKQFIKRGDKPGVALHKAASSVKHVTDRGLQQFLKR